MILRCRVPAQSMAGQKAPVFNGNQIHALDIGEFFQYLKASVPFFPLRTNDRAVSRKISFEDF